jgi:uncharacterized membrane protein
VTREIEVLSKNRVEALTDGIYAVAMTLLVLELKLPEAHGNATPEAFAQALLHLIPKLVAWILSFAILAIFWFAHHRTYDHVLHVDRKLLRINMLSMLFASLLPFSTAMVGDYNNLFLAQAFYAANMSVLALLAIWQLSHLVKHPELCEAPGFPRGVARGARFRCWSLVATTVLAMSIAYFEPRYGTMAFMLMIILGRIGRRLEAQPETNP